MSTNYQQVTMTVIVKDEDVESIKREFNQTLEILEDDYQLHQTSVLADACDDPEEEDLYEFEDAA